MAKEKVMAESKGYMGQDKRGEPGGESMEKEKNRECGKARDCSRGRRDEEIESLRDENQKLREALQDAESASKAKDVFLSNMSHDIRTPMNAIMGMTTIAMSHIDEKNRVLDCLEKIQTASSHLMSLINDVLDMSHIESGKMTIRKEPFSLPDVFHDVVVIVRAQAEQKQQSLKFEIGDIRFEEFIGDALRIRQVLVNIIGNAIKYTPKGGDIRVILRELPGEGKERVLEFTCQDNGIGMSEEFLSRVFLPFERAGNTTQSKIEGTGLGLAICHRLVEQMHGAIRVESRLGEGSRFTVSIPLAMQEEKSVERPFRGETVLVVEHAPSQAKRISEYLADGGLKAQIVGKSVEAVTTLTEALYEEKSPCAILLGEDLDGAYALDVAACLRQIAGKSIPILLVSEADWPQMEYRAVRAGINGFVPCPLFRSRLLSAIHEFAVTEGGEVASGDLERMNYSGKRFLMAEDNLLNQEIAIELLSDMGIMIEAADNGEEAVKMFEASQPGYYDLILMDIQMPVMDGYEATRRIRGLSREDASDICIVAMTANVFAEDVRRSKAAGMNYHLAKPIDTKKIEEVLQKMG